MGESTLSTPAGPSGASSFSFKNTIGQMVQRNASDLLLKVGRPPTVRVNGELLSLDVPPLKPEDLKALAEQVMTPRQVKEFAEKKEADFAIGVPGVGRFRTNIYQQRGTLAFAFRAIPYEVKTIRELHLPVVLEEVSLKPRGLVLVTGITGSGKSTALAAMINHVGIDEAAAEDPEADRGDHEGGHHPLLRLHPAHPRQLLARPGDHLRAALDPGRAEAVDQPG